MAYTEAKIMYLMTSLSNAVLRETASTTVAKYTWTPAKRWTVRGAVINPTTAIGASGACILYLKHTPSGGSATSMLTVTVTSGLGIGTEQVFTEATTGYGTFDINSGDTLGIYVTTALGAVVGVLDVILILSEKP